MIPSLSRFSLLLTALPLAFVACAQPSGDLVLAEDWAFVPPSEDPVEGQPDDATACPSRAAIIEAGALEVDTSVCDWITLEAPSRMKVRRGTAIDLFVFHQALAAPEPAEAVIGVRLGEDAPWTWSETVPVPSTSAYYDAVIELEETLKEGDPILFHVHNHGANTYTLGHLRVP